MEEKIMSAILEGRSYVEIDGVIFDRLPECPRDNQKKREIFARAEAKKRIEWLMAD